MVEIEEHCQTIIRRHLPASIPLMGDICDVHASDFTRTPDLLIGGFPCKDTSIAAPNRAGLAGTRSGLFFEQLRLIDEFGRLVDSLERPEWVVIENPEGVLKSNGGRDWGVVTDSLAQRGYGWAYRVIDAGVSVPSSAADGSSWSAIVAETPDPQDKSWVSPETAAKLVPRVESASRVRGKEPDPRLLTALRALWRTGR